MYSVSKQAFRQTASCLALVLILCGCSRERKLFEEAQQEGRQEHYKAYLAAYPEGKYASEARNAITKLEYEAAKAKQTAEALSAFVERHRGTPWAGKAQEDIQRIAYMSIPEDAPNEAFTAFLEAHPTGPWADRARSALVDRAYAEASEKDTPEAYAAFLGKHGGTPQAQKHREKVAFEKAREDGSPESYAEFLKQFPAGEHAQKVRDALNKWAYGKAKRADSTELSEETFLKLAQADDRPLGYETFLRIFPESEQIEDVRAQLAKAKQAQVARREPKREELRNMAAALIEKTDELWVLRQGLPKRMGFDTMMAAIKAYGDELKSRNETIGKSWYGLIDHTNGRGEEDPMVSQAAWTHLGELWFPMVTRHISGVVTQIEAGHFGEVFEKLADRETAPETRSRALAVAGKLREMEDLFNTDFRRALSVTGI